MTLPAINPFEAPSMVTPLPFAETAAPEAFNPIQLSWSVKRDPPWTDTPDSFQPVRLRLRTTLATLLVRRSPAAAARFPPLISTTGPLNAYEYWVVPSSVVAPVMAG